MCLWRILERYEVPRVCKNVFVNGSVSWAKQHSCFGLKSGRRVKCQTPRGALTDVDRWQDCSWQKPSHVLTSRAISPLCPSLLWTQRPPSHLLQALPQRSDVSSRRVWLKGLLHNSSLHLPLKSGTNRVKCRQRFKSCPAFLISRRIHKVKVRLICRLFIAEWKINKVKVTRLSLSPHWYQSDLCVIGVACWHWGLDKRMWVFWLLGSLYICQGRQIQFYYRHNHAFMSTNAAATMHRIIIIVKNAFHFNIFRLILIFTGIQEYSWRESLTYLFLSAEAHNSLLRRTKC